MTVYAAELRRRARSCIVARVPECVRTGSANIASQYKNAAAICASYVQRGGAQLGRVQAAVETLERFQGLR